MNELVPPTTPLDLLASSTEGIAAQRPAEAPSVLSRLIYIGLIVIPALLVALVVLSRAGVIATSAQASRTPWGLAIVILCGAVVCVVAGLIARRVPSLRERARSEVATDHLLAKAELFALTASLLPATVLLALAIVASTGELAWGSFAPSLLAAFALLAVSGPIAYFAWVREKRIREIEERFPDFLRDLNESHGAGLTMAQAIRVASRGDYGRLNPEIQRMAHQVSWGVPFADALKMFAERVGTPIVMRAVALINKATRAGGNAKDVLAAAARDAREVKGIQQERRLGMTLYVIVIYVAFGVFLAVVAALQGLLVPALLSSTSAVAGQPTLAGMTLGGGPNLADFRLIYFGIGLVQAIGSGLVAGVMAEGGYAAGMKHVAILTAISILTLGILL